MSASPMVIGTNSATVIQSMPSMKLVRLTNQRQASSSSARSIHHGSIGTTRSSAGRLASMMPTANVCSSKPRRDLDASGDRPGSDRGDECGRRENQAERARIE